MPFAKCNCQHCGGHIEFPVEMAGQNVACPHCQIATLLAIPPIAVLPTRSIPKSKAKNTKLKVGITLLLVALAATFAIWKFERQKQIARLRLETETELSKGDLDGAVLSLRKLKLDFGLNQDDNALLHKLAADLEEIRSLKVISLTNPPKLTIKLVQGFLAKHPNNSDGVVILNIALKKSQDETALEAKFKEALAKQDLAAVAQALDELERIRSLSDEELLLKGKSKKAIQSLSEISAAKAEHFHEKIVLLAGALLDDFPNSTDAKQSFKQSGLILNHANVCSEMLGKFLQQKLTDTNDLFAVVMNWIDGAVSLDLAGSHAAEAVKLDSGFSPAVKLSERVNTLKSIAGTILAERAYNLATSAFALAESVGVPAHNKYAEIQNTYVPSGLYGLSVANQTMKKSKRS